MTPQDTTGALQPTSQVETNTSVLDWVKRLEAGRRTHTTSSNPKPSDPVTETNKKISVASLINSKSAQPTPEFSKGMSSTNPKPSELGTPIAPLTNPKPHVSPVQAMSSADAQVISSTLSDEVQGSVAQLKRLFAS